MMRNLNDYESMLSRSTCNVALRINLTFVDDGASSSTSASEKETRTKDARVESYLRSAWSRCVSERTFLQVVLVERDDEECVGPLGQRYGVASVGDDAVDMLFTVRHNVDDNLDMVKELQTVGTTALDISKGTYAVSCHVEKTDTSGGGAESARVTIFLSLCHAVSDGPGALKVARSFLAHLGDIVNGSDGVKNGPLSSLEYPPQPLADLQAMLIGNDYSQRPISCSTNENRDALYNELNEIRSVLATAPNKPMRVNGMTFLPPEAMQDLPSDPGFGVEPSVIDTVHFAMNVDETESLRRNCRTYGATVQGALTAAALMSRVRLLDLPRPVKAAVQVPIDTRPLAPPSADVGDACLCGSAGVWHTAEVREGERIFELARRCTEAVRRAQMGGEQPREWLYRLLNEPATLPPYSLMVSSIGVAPIETAYGPKVSVDKVLFFGGSLRTKEVSKSRGTMVHVVTFAGELNCMVNFTFPGISRRFAEDLAFMLRSTLLAMAHGKEVAN